MSKAKKGRHKINDSQDAATTPIVGITASIAQESEEDTADGADNEAMDPFDLWDTLQKLPNGQADKIMSKIGQGWKKGGPQVRNATKACLR